MRMRDNSSNSSIRVSSSSSSSSSDSNNNNNSSSSNNIIDRSYNILTEVDHILRKSRRSNKSLQQNNTTITNDDSNVEHQILQQQLSKGIVAQELLEVQNQLFFLFPDLQNDILLRNSNNNNNNYMMTTTTTTPPSRRPIQQHRAATSTSTTPATATNIHHLSRTSSLPIHNTGSTTRTATGIQQQQQHHHHPLLHSGVLYKRRDVLKHQWRPRWFILNIEQGTLTYYLLSTEDESILLSSSSAAAAAASSLSANVNPNTGASDTAAANNDTTTYNRNVSLTPQQQPYLIRNRTTSYDSSSFVTNNNIIASDNTMDYDVVPRGTIYLGIDCTISINEVLSKSDLYVFTIRTTTNGTIHDSNQQQQQQKHVITLHLATRTVELRNVWIEQLRTAVCNLRQQQQQQQLPINGNNVNTSNNIRPTTVTTTPLVQSRIPSSLPPIPATVPNSFRPTIDSSRIIHEEQSTTILRPRQLLLSSSENTSDTATVNDNTLTNLQEIGDGNDSNNNQQEQQKHHPAPIASENVTSTETEIFLPKKNIFTVLDIALQAAVLFAPIGFYRLIYYYSIGPYNISGLLFCASAYLTVRQIICYNIGEAILTSNEVKGNESGIIDHVRCQLDIDLKGILRYISNLNDERNEMKESHNTSNKNATTADVSVLHIVAFAISHALQKEPLLRTRTVSIPYMFIHRVIDTSHEPIDVTIAENDNGLITIPSVDQCSNIQDIANCHQLIKDEASSNNNTPNHKVGKCLIVAMSHCNDSITSEDEATMIDVVPSLQRNNSNDVLNVVVVLNSVYLDQQRDKNTVSSSDQPKPYLRMTLTITGTHRPHDIVICQRFVNEVRKLLLYPEICDNPATGAN